MLRKRKTLGRRTLGQKRVAEETLNKGLFDRLSGYQQAVLLLAGFAYAFGYASRALHAFENNLGALPGVRFEYLVAGTLLLIPPVSLCLAIWGVWRSAKWLAAWAAKAPQRMTRIQNALTGGMALGLGTILLPDPVYIVGIVLSIGCFLYLLLYFSAGGESVPTSHTTTERVNVGKRGKLRTRLGRGLRWLWRAAGKVWTVVTALWIGLLLLGLFILAVGYGAITLKYVPQELGGVKPKCGVLDLSPEQLSPELRTLIADPGQHLDPSSKVVRSIPLDVFTTSEPWLVRLPRAGVPARSRSIRLDGKVVLSVEWCH